jgi:hypothetical protein
MMFHRSTQDTDVAIYAHIGVVRHEFEMKDLADHMDPLEEDVLVDSGVRRFGQVGLQVLVGDNRTTAWHALNLSRMVPIPCCAVVCQ